MFSQRREEEKISWRNTGSEEKGEVRRKSIKALRPVGTLGEKTKKTRALFVTVKREKKDYLTLTLSYEERG